MNPVATPSPRWFSVRGAEVHLHLDRIALAVPAIVAGHDEAAGCQRDRVVAEIVGLDRVDATVVEGEYIDRRPVAGGLIKGLRAERPIPPVTRNPRRDLCAQSRDCLLRARRLRTKASNRQGRKRGEETGSNAQRRGQHRSDPKSAEGAATKPNDRTTDEGSRDSGEGHRSCKQSDGAERL
jgi:hypothetical protein